jgi:hypothetical protein
MGFVSALIDEKRSKMKGIPCKVHPMTRKSTWILQILALFSLSVLPTKAEDAPTAAETPTPPSFNRIVEYTPTAVYVGDSITCCFRVENATTATAELELLTQTFDADGKELRSQLKNLNLAAQKTKSIQIDLDSESGKKILFTLRRKNETEMIEQTRMCLVRDNEVWPDTAVRNTRMETHRDAEIIVLLVKKRRRVEDRSYAPLKWLVASTTGTTSGVSEGSGVAYVPNRWEIEKSARRQIIPSYKNNGVSPILMATDAILKSLQKIKSDTQTVPERIVVALPPEDLDVGTDPQVYKLVLETLLSQMHLLGVKEIVLIPPVQFGAAEQPLRSLWKVVHETARLYHCQSVDVTEYMKEQGWRIDAASKGVYGLKPNAEGLKKFEQGLTNLLP